jgi:hypothetical protein
METMVQFGPDRRLVGVLTDPGAPSNMPTVILPSAGLLPRAGPFRLHVELARRLAAQGVRSFRFDVPGVGEAPRLNGCGGREATVAALDHLSAYHGAEDFVVGGVCSAADVAWNVAVDDRRVRGVLMLDGLSYTGPWFRFALLAGVLKRAPTEWPGVLARWLGRARQTERKPLIEDYRDWPERPQAQDEFARLVARDVRSLWVYTGGYTGQFLHPRQFAWSFGDAVRDRRVAMHYWPDCDHTFFARTHRDRLLDTVEQWLMSNFHIQAVPA